MQKPLLLTASKTFLLPLILSAYTLSGCVPVALVAAGATAGGAVVYDKRPVQTMAEDRNTASQILKKISDDPALSAQAAHITVAAFNNLLLIAGQTSTPALRDRTYQIVNNTPGIKRIYNEITVAPPTSASTQARDSWLTTKVKSAMLAEKGLSSTHIKVVTENSVVYLMGVVTHKQADVAADVASSISGVSKVVRIFEYEQ